MEKENATRKGFIVSLACFLFLFLLFATPYAFADGSIHVVKPEGNTTYDRAFKLPIVYDAFGLSSGSPLKAVLYRNGVEIGTIKENLPNSGRISISWKVGSLDAVAVPDGSGYAIRVQTQDGTVFGECEGNFSIASPDLYIPSVRPEKDASSNNIHLWITVNRRGAKLHLEKSEHLYMRIRSRDVATYQIPDRNYNQLNDRGETTIFWTLRYPRFRPWAHIKIDSGLNGSGTIEESNEHNNTFDVSLNLRPTSRFPTSPGLTNNAARQSRHKAFPGVQPTPIKPDLRITRARYSESGGKLWLTFHVVNATFDKGARLNTALSNNGLSYQKRVSGAPSGANYAIGQNDFNTLNRRGYVDIKVELFQDHVGKAITIKIDNTNVVAETNEHNNEFTAPAYARKVKQHPRSFQSPSKGKTIRGKSASKPAPVKTSAEKSPTQPRKNLSK